MIQRISVGEKRYTYDESRIVEKIKEDVKCFF